MDVFHLQKLSTTLKKTYFLACVCISLYCIVSFSQDFSRFSLTTNISDKRTTMFMRNGTVIEEMNCPGKLIRSNFSYKCHNDCKTSACYINNDSIPSWDERNLIKHSGNQRYLAFDQTISEAEWSAMIDLLDIFRHSCLNHSVSYFLYGGSLLGAYRHFGFIPWDDDIDVMVNASERGRIQDILQAISGYAVHAPDNIQWKFYKIQETTQTINASNDGNRKKSIKVPWPFIDIFFFSENETHIWDDNPMYSSIYKFLKDDVFPLTFLPFERLVAAVPRRPHVILDRSYNVHLCVSPSFCHREERQSDRRQMSLPCKRLLPYFTFVALEQHGEFVLRRLMFANKFIHYEIITDNVL